METKEYYQSVIAVIKYVSDGNTVLCHRTYQYRSSFLILLVSLYVALFNTPAKSVIGSINQFFSRIGKYLAPTLRQVYCITIVIKAFIRQIYSQPIEFLGRLYIFRQQLQHVLQGIGGNKFPMHKTYGLSIISFYQNPFSIVGCSTRIVIHTSCPVQHCFFQFQPQLLQVLHLLYIQYLLIHTTQSLRLLHDLEI